MEINLDKLSKEIKKGVKIIIENDFPYHTAPSYQMAYLFRKRLFNTIYENFPLDIEELIKEIIEVMPLYPSEKESIKNDADFGKYSGFFFIIRLWIIKLKKDYKIEKW